jgi:hypothetical protein
MVYYKSRGSGICPAACRLPLAGCKSSELHLNPEMQAESSD